MAPTVRTFVDTAARLHALPLPDGASAEFWVCRPTGPALVMGSAQRSDAFDRAALDAAGVDLAPRRSGGGAVYIEPSGVVWIDVVAPRSSPWWNEELGETFLRVGRCWQQALAACGIDGSVFDAAPERSDVARHVCWAGVGWGEVVVDGHKLVGLSQRRTRWGARVQAMAVLDGSAARAADWFVDPAPAVTAWRRSAANAGVGVDPGGLERAVLAALGAAGTH